MRDAVAWAPERRAGGESSVEMAAKPARQPAQLPICRLAPFDAAWAERITAWVRTPQETYWLAPKTAPPLTAADLLAWRGPGHTPHLLVVPGRPAPLGYGELNHLDHGRREYWLGHLIVDPTERGQGLGVQLTRLLLTQAFESRGAKRVTLVVFRENEVALRCYRAAGMCDDGYEWHAFPAYDRRECLVRLAAVRGFWR